MKTELRHIAFSLEEGDITENQARTLLLGLLGVRESLSEYHDDHIEVLSEFVKLPTIDHPEFPQDRLALEYALKILKSIKIEKL